jgi:hypothetical protein
MSYVIKNEDSEVMRIVGRKEEAIAICSLRAGWSYTRVVAVKPKFVFEDAPF